MRYYSFSLDKPVIYFMGGEFTSSSPWKHLERYRKGDYEIIFCIKGPIYLQIGNDQYVVDSKHIIIVPPYTHVVGFRKSTSPVDFYWLHFFPQCGVTISTGNNISSVSNFSNKFEIKNTITLPAIFKIKDYQNMIIIFHRLLSAKDSLHITDKRDFIASTLLIELFENCIQDNEQTTENAKVDHIKKWITSHMSSSLSVNDVAEHANLNRNYLTRLFKQNTGMTTLQYIMKLKIEIASLLLLRTEYSVKEVAYNAYFTNPKMFMRRFKIETGYSPTEFRNQYGSVLKNTSHVDPFIPVPSRISDSINDGVNEDVLKNNNNFQPDKSH